MGLKGTDSSEIVALARKLGATAEAPFRALQALKELEILKDSIEIITCPGAMGGSVANKCGFKVSIIGPAKEETSAEDTRQAALEMMKLQIELLLFAGGDGTARDIYSSIKNAMPVIGIPAGVKMHSSIFALNPKRAGELALLYLTGKVKKPREAEVMDIDEELFRKGVVSARLYGYLKIPFERRYVQNVKTATPPSEKYEQEAIAAEVVENMEQDCIYIVGPWTTTRQIMQLLGLDSSLLGVDVVSNGKLLAKDVSEKTTVRNYRRQTFQTDSHTYWRTRIYLRSRKSAIEPEDHQKDRKGQHNSRFHQRQAAFLERGSTSRGQQRRRSR